MYDAHGNMVATLAKSGGGYAVSNRRAYDAWGVIRQGSTTGDPKGRYCASLGHVQDDESGLVYMRARYYEPTSGRFVSEDTGGPTLNLYIYASNCPISRADVEGKADADDAWHWFNKQLGSWIESRPFKFIVVPIVVYLLRYPTAVIAKLCLRAAAGLTVSAEGDFELTALAARGEAGAGQAMLFGTIGALKVVAAFMLTQFALLLEMLPDSLGKLA